MVSTSYSQLGFPARSTLQVPKKIQTIFISHKRYIRQAWKEALADVSTRWPLFFLILWFNVLFVILIFLTLYLHPPSGACRPDGTFSPFTGYSYWDASGFFQITLGFGSFTFTQVKVIDTVWDIVRKQTSVLRFKAHHLPQVIGRVGQGILAYFSWRIFADYATVSMETTPLTYTSFTILFMEGDPAFTSICQLLWDFVLYRRLRSGISTTWVIVSMVFVLAWPTLIAAMSGYSPEAGAYVKDLDENLVPYNEFRPLAYIIHDGTRINLTADYAVPLGPRPGFAWGRSSLSLSAFCAYLG